MTPERQPPDFNTAGLLSRRANSQAASQEQSALSTLIPHPAGGPATPEQGEQRSRQKPEPLKLNPFRSLGSSARPKRPRPQGRRTRRLPRFLITALLVGIIWFLAIHFGRPANLPMEPQPTPGGAQTPTPGSATQTPVVPTSTAAPNAALSGWH